MVKWEAELGKDFSTLQWQNATKWAHTASACASHREQFPKILTRWYFTPLRISKAYPTASPYCWRSCGSVGSLLHVFWNCTSLKPFWNQIFNLITSITQLRIPETPALALLLEIETIPVVHRVVVCNILHAARLSIARHWKSKDPPSLSEVHEIVSNICIQERALAWFRGTTTKFQNAWASWISFLPL